MSIQNGLAVFTASGAGQTRRRFGNGPLTGLVASWVRSRPTRSAPAPAPVDVGGAGPSASAPAPVDVGGAGPSASVYASMTVCIALAAACLVFSVTSFARHGIALDWASAEGSMYVLTVTILLARLTERLPRVRGAFLVISWLLVLPLTFAPFSYAMAGVAFPLCDGYLMAMDHALGFDWMAYYELVRSSPLTVTVLKYAYASIMWQFIGLAVLLAFLGNLSTCFRLLAAHCLTLTAVIVVGAVVPATGAPTFMGLTQADFPDINMFGTFGPMPHFHALREGTFRIFSLDGATGIVAFPSFHTSSAVLYAMAGWRIRFLRWPVLLLNVAMLAATPVFGGHYLVDMVAGAVIAVAVYRSVPRLHGVNLRSVHRADGLTLANAG